MKNYVDTIIFRIAICFWAKANSSYGRREIACANFSSPLRDKSLGNEEWCEKMTKMTQKKIALINDLSGYGRCAITVELPIISALKVQCCPLPTSILSNHTGFDSYYFDDYTDKMLPFMQEWEKIGLCFDGICTGFLGSEKQIDIVRIFIEKFKTKDTVVIVDPVMGDNGEKYKTYTETMCEKMRHLVACADIVTPNLTEACIITGMPYKENHNQKELQELAYKILSMGPERIVITGIQQNNYVANYCMERGQSTGYFVKCEKAGIQRCGTGDIFTSIIAAEAVKGTDFKLSVKKAAVFVKKCIIKSVEMGIPLTDGVCFEELLTTLR